MEISNKLLTTVLFYSMVMLKSKYSYQIIRGIPPEKTEFYAPGKHFVCLDGTFTIPYSFINDDYCDCLDASDEPGTSACINGTFHCINTGYLSLNIPSSRVNDGICDCCDGSDEWANDVPKVTCKNMCEQLYHIAKKQSIRVDNLYSLGFKKREQLIMKGKQIILLKQNTITQLLSKKKEALLIKSKTFVDKKVAQAKEKEAKEEETLKEQNEALKIFNEIDTNKNNKIGMDEVISYNIFDQNYDGIVLHDEINHIMMNKTELDFKDFISSGWNRVKLLIYSKYVGAKYPVKINDNVKDPNHKVVDYDESILINELLYSEKTKTIINESKIAHGLFDDAERRVKDIENTIRNLQESLRKDFGTDNEFAALEGQCFEHVDHEYIYQLCLFAKATQRAIKGGPEVVLGVWKNWTYFNSNEPKYHTMLYENGYECYNSHRRFTRVHLSCGLEPKLVSVTEPNRCEYLMEFEVPSVCVIQDAKYSREEYQREEL